LQAATVPDHEATHLLPPDPASIVLARRAVEALPLGLGRTGEVKLIVSELVTNSIEHGELGAHDRIEVHALVDRRGALHMEVRDPGPGPSPGARRGMGWRILERMADRWGTDRSDGLARVWFELDAGEGGR
jgi:anti-sigma regulatory factor (Ser/Thr protein kinase)